MLKFPCLVLDHDDTVVQSEATVHFPCFEEFLKIYRPGTVYTLADYVRDCGIMSFVDLCRIRFGMTEAELQVEYRFWKDYVKNHIPLPFPGIRELLEAYRAAGGKICVVSMSSEDTILRDYRVHFGFEPDLVFGCDQPEEHRKPSTYAPEQICQRFGFRPSELLVVDDMAFAVPMARNAGCPMAFAAWGRLDYPEVCAEMERRCDYVFRSPEHLKHFLLEE